MLTRPIPPGYFQIGINPYGLGQERLTISYAVLSKTILSYYFDTFIFHLLAIRSVHLNKLTIKTIWIQIITWFQVYGNYDKQPYNSTTTTSRTKGRREFGANVDRSLRLCFSRQLSFLSSVFVLPLAACTTTTEVFFQLRLLHTFSM